jgi:hypothetical protein
MPFVKRGGAATKRREAGIERYLIKPIGAAALEDRSLFENL